MACSNGVEGGVGRGGEGEEGGEGGEGGEGEEGGECIPYPPLSDTHPRVCTGQSTRALHPVRVLLVCSMHC